MTEVRSGTRRCFDDKIYGEDRDDWIDGRLGNDVIDGGAGINIVSYESRDGFRLPLMDVFVDPSAGSAHIGSETDLLINIQNVYGGAGNDHLVGDGADNALYGGPGDDVLEGKAGCDVLDGGPGINVIDQGACP
jgi:Ca2+-binding RTX toxin-like protein